MRSIRKFFSAVTVALVALSLLALGSASPAGASEDTRGMEHEFIARINDLRGSMGLAPLATDEGQLHDVAVSWSSSMADAGGISHRSNLGEVAPSDWVRLGENVGVGPSVESLHNAFVASPGHYRNLVDPSFEAIAVGVVVRDGRIFVTENFITRAPTGATVAAFSAPAAAGDTVAKATPAKSCKAKKCKAARRPAKGRARRR